MEALKFKRGHGPWPCPSFSTACAEQSRRLKTSVDNNNYDV